MKKNKTIIMLSSVLVILLLVIALNFAIHVVRTNSFNSKYYTEDSTDTDYSVSVSTTTSQEWDKEDALVDGVTNGNIYAFIVDNRNDYGVDDWNLKINIPKECYLNQDWNGTVEIHQNVKSGNEIVETLDLHNFSFSYDDLKLEYAGVGKDNLMIHLYEGDYIIYHPSNDGGAHEYPLSGTNHSVEVALILYYDTSLEITDFSLTYSFGKSIAQGPEFIICCVLSGVWLILLSVTLAWVIIKRNDQKELDIREAMLKETVGLITRFVDAKDTYTNGHSTRVAEYTVLLAEKLHLPKEEQEHAYYIAILHDIGKCYVPDEILKKPGRLTDEEFKTIKSHTSYGAEMLKNIKSMPSIADGAHYHHERYDGKGYPEGLRGEDIPFIARIICVADSFDAMTSSRCYRSALPKEKVLSELETNKGHQFDPAVADCMIELINEGKVSIKEWE